MGGMSRPTRSGDDHANAYFAGMKPTSEMIAAASGDDLDHWINFIASCEFLSAIATS